MTADPLNLAALRQVAEEGARGWIPSGSTFRTTFDPPTVLALLDLAERATAAEAAVGCSICGEMHPWRKRGNRSAVSAALDEAREFCEATIAGEMGILQGEFADGWRAASSLILDELRDRAVALDPAPATEVRDDEGGA